MILVTGSAGRIGRAVVKALLEAGLPTRGFDRYPTPGLPDSIEGEIQDEARLKTAFQGASTLIHLAAVPDDADFLTQLLPTNIVGLYHVMECARHAGVRRIILASSGQVNWWQRETENEPIRVTDPPSPRYWYAATKMFAESIGRGFAEVHGISVVAVRLGWVPRDAAHVRELESLEWARDVYLSPGDVGRFFVAAVKAPADLKFATCFVTSRPIKTEWYELAPARELFGWEPRDQWPEGLDIGQD